MLLWILIKVYNGIIKFIIAPLGKVTILCNWYGELGAKFIIGVSFGKMSLLLRQIIHHVNYIHLSSITSSHPLAYTIVFSFGFDFTNFLGNFPALFGIECCPKCLQRRFWKVYQTVLTESMPRRLGFRSQTRGIMLPYLTLFIYYGSFLCCWFIFLKRIRANRNSLF